MLFLKTFDCFTKKYLPTIISNNKIKGKRLRNKFLESGSRRWKVEVEGSEDKQVLKVQTKEVESFK